MKIKCLAAIAAVSIFGMTALASCSDEPEVTESDLDSAAESVEGLQMMPVMPLRVPLRILIILSIVQIFALPSSYWLLLIGDLAMLKS